MAGSTRHLVAILVLLVVGEGNCSCGTTRQLDDDELNTCTSSSEYNSRFSCEKAFDEIATKEFESEVDTSKGEGEGAWIKAKFFEPQWVKKVKLVQRANKEERNVEVELEFSEGEKDVWDLGSRGSVSDLTLPVAISTSSLKVTITEVADTPYDPDITIDHGWEEIKIYVCA